MVSKSYCRVFTVLNGSLPARLLFVQYPHGLQNFTNKSIKSINSVYIRIKVYSRKHGIFNVWLYKNQHISNKYQKIMRLRRKSTEDYYGGLRKISLQFISDSDFKKIERASAFLKYKKGETILRQGNLPTHVAFLQSGIVKFNYFSEDSGKNTILTVVSAPKILGGANLFYKDNNLFSIVAVEDCEAYIIEANVLLELMKDNGTYAVVLFQLASEMFKKSILNFISVVNKQKEGRIADVFVYLSEEVYSDTVFNLSLTRKEVAEYACCSVENVIMTLSKWQQEGIVDVHSKQIKINDLDKLRQISKIG